jgi:hypothetical protein
MVIDLHLEPKLQLLGVRGEKGSSGNGLVVRGAGFLVSTRGMSRTLPSCPLDDEGKTREEDFVCPYRPDPRRRYVKVPSINRATDLDRATEYDCVWKQPSNDNWEQVTPGIAVEFERVECNFPQWYGKATQVDLYLRGSILEHKGCYDLSDVLNSDFEQPTNGQQRGGISACQVRSDEDDPKARVFALMESGCYYSVASMETLRTKTSVKKVEDSKCNLRCEKFKNSGFHYDINDAKVHQRCGDQNGKYATVFEAKFKGAEDSTLIKAGTYEIIPGDPDAPTWDAKSIGQPEGKPWIAGPGSVKMQWSEPLFNGGAEVTNIEQIFARAMDA